MILLACVAIVSCYCCWQHYLDSIHQPITSAVTSPSTTTRVPNVCTLILSKMDAGVATQVDAIYELADTSFWGLCLRAVVAKVGALAPWGVMFRASH